MLPPHPQDAVLYPPGCLVRALIRPSRFVTQAFDPFFLVPPTPPSKSSLRDPEDAADVLGPDVALDVLLDRA
jgi:hypothetical protein